MDKSVAVEPQRIPRIEFEVACEQGGDDVGGPERRAGMPLPARSIASIDKKRIAWAIRHALTRVMIVNSADVAPGDIGRTVRVARPEQA